MDILILESTDRRVHKTPELHLYASCQLETSGAEASKRKELKAWKIEK
jgi:hypothetical protein